MDPRLQRRVQRYGWDKGAPHYDRGWAAPLAPAVNRLLELAAIAPGEHVLDVACGTGAASLPAARSTGAKGRVLGVDLAEAMVTAVTERARSEGIAHAEFARMDAEQLAVPDASFDVALCSLGLMYVPDPARALAELRRAVKDGGRVVVAVWGARASCGWAEIFPIVDARVQSDVCPLFFQLGTGETLAHRVRDAGFASVTSERLQTTLRFASADDACDAAFLGGPVALAYSRFDEPTRAEARAAYLASIERYRQGAAYDVPGEFVLVHGR